MDELKNKAIALAKYHAHHIGIFAAGVIIGAIIWQVFMECAKMNYYFTGLLIIMLTVLAFCGGPSAY